MKNNSKFILTLFALVYISCKQNMQQKSIDIPELIKTISSDTNHKILNRDDKLKLFQELQKNLYSGEGGPLDPETFNQMIITHPNSTQWVFFYREDILRVLSTIPDNCSAAGIKFYLRTHPDTLKDSDRNRHRYAKRQTIVMWATCNGDTILGNRDALYDYGDVCPPNCNITCTYLSRDAKDYKNGVCCEQRLPTQRPCDKN